MTTAANTLRNVQLIDSLLVQGRSRLAKQEANLVHAQKRDAKRLVWSATVMIGREKKNIEKLLADRKALFAEYDSKKEAA